MLFTLIFITIVEERGSSPSAEMQLRVIFRNSGACLTQPCPGKDGPVPGIPEEVPIYFLSHKLTSTQKKRPVIEKEAFPIVYALQKLDYYF